ncbi:sulfatase family protein [Sphingomonas sp. 37zxx]|uniref:sulfatase family protein n=1 Tax=Sphingomonas sp. 37zxx TaxID=1550073 RepID=UPI0018CF4D5F|nr:sulfatase [Sphingomonas sp. 37zxx]
MFIIADDHGTDAIGAWGNRTIQTPALDALARDGTRFTSAFATSASCSPSRSVLLTGQQGHRNGAYGLEHNVHHFQAFETVQSLPVMLARNGYRTGRIGKYHVGPESVFHFDEVLAPEMAKGYSLGRSPVEMANAATPFLSKSDQPFFLYFAFEDPHRIGPYEPDTANSFGNRPGSYPGVRSITYDPAKVTVPPFLPDRPEVRAELAQYYQSVSRMDQGIATLIAALKKAGKYDNTIIVYLSDNGIAFPGAKTTLYDPGIRLPLIIKQPKSTRAGSVSDALVSWTDITPTLLDMTGAARNLPKFDGTSLRPVLAGAPEVPGRDAIFGSHTMHEVTMYYPMRMIRDHRYKLIWNIAAPLTYPSASDLFQSSTWTAAMRRPDILYGKRSITAYLHRPTYELYDLQSDPDEVRNLADLPAHQAALKTLKGKLLAYLKTTRDPWLVKQDYE